MCFRVLLKVVICGNLVFMFVFVWVEKCEGLLLVRVIILLFVLLVSYCISRKVVFLCLVFFGMLILKLLV